jgi:hypothetical protein
MLKLLTAVALAGVMTIAGTAGAQKTESMGTGKGGSPHQKTTWTVSGATISIAYGRPFLKGRPEAQLMPVGEPWRTGADEASVITSDKPLTFGDVKLAPGSYTINTEPGGKEWHIIFGKLNAPDQWGVPYQKPLEIGRAPMKLTKASAPVEQVTFAIDAGASPTLKVEWGTAVAAVPFTVGK